MDEIKNGSVGRVAKTTCACGDGCRCGCGRGHRVIWWIVGIVILVFVFALGVKAGEFRDELRSAFGGYYHGYPMMQGGQQYQGGIPSANYPSGGGGSVSTGTPTGL